MLNKRNNSKVKQEKNPNYQKRNLLTKREIEVLEHIIKGESNAKIANFFKISTSAIKIHTVKIYEKLNVENRVQASVKAIKLNIIE